MVMNRQTMMEGWMVMKGREGGVNGDEGVDSHGEVDGNEGKGWWTMMEGKEGVGGW